MDFSNFLQSISAYILPIGLIFALLVSFLIVYFASHKPAKSVPVANICQKRRLSFKIFVILPLLCVAVLPSVCLSSAYADSENSGSKVINLTINSFSDKSGDPIIFKSEYDVNTSNGIKFYYKKDNSGYPYGYIQINLVEVSNPHNKQNITLAVQKHEANTANPTDFSGTEFSANSEKVTYYYISISGDYLASGDKTTYIIKDFSTDWYLSWAGQAKQWLESNRLPLIITLLVAGGFLAVFLGINLAKAEDAAAATKAKQRMLYLVIGIFVTIILLFFLDWLLGNIDTIQTSIQQHVTDSNSVKFLEKLK